MKFELLDSIIEFTSRERLVAVKAVTQAEEYLADHFPTFPVLPGVMMLQALVEAGGWLAREALDFAPSTILLRQARNVTYKSFVKPGNLLRVEVAAKRIDADESEFTGVGYCRETEVVKARFGLRHLQLTQRDLTLEAVERKLVAAARARFAYLRGPVGNT